MADTATEEKQAEAAEQAPEGVEVQDAELPEAEGQPAAAGGGQIDILLDTEVPLEVRLGGVELPIRDVLQLAPGSVVALEKQAGEPLDLYLRDVKFATGHLVVVGDRLGVRIKEVLSRPE
jgi:flagellar motor switch protein FliN/FliY